MSSLELEGKSDPGDFLVSNSLTFTRCSIHMKLYLLVVDDLDFLKHLSLNTTQTLDPQSLIQGLQTEEDTDLMDSGPQTTPLILDSDSYFSSVLIRLIMNIGEWEDSLVK